MKLSTTQLKALKALNATQDTVSHTRTCGAAYVDGTFISVGTLWALSERGLVECYRQAVTEQNSGRHGFGRRLHLRTTFWRITALGRETVSQ